MASADVDLSRLSLREDVPVVPLGVWWTYDAPSLIVPRRDADPVRIWCTGEGPSVLVIPAPGEQRDDWETVATLLGTRFTLHAMERPQRCHDTPLTAGERDVEHVATSARSVGAPVILGSVADAAAIVAAAARGGVTGVVLVGPAADVPGDAGAPPEPDAPPVRVRVVAPPPGWPRAVTAGDAGAVVDALLLVS